MPSAMAASKAVTARFSRSAFISAGFHVPVSPMHPRAIRLTTGPSAPNRCWGSRCSVFAMPISLSRDPPDRPAAFRLSRVHFPQASFHPNGPISFAVPFGPFPHHRPSSGHVPLVAGRSMWKAFRNLMSVLFEAMEINE
jgi:hypothetical protein